MKIRQIKYKSFFIAFLAAAVTLAFSSPTVMAGENSDASASFEVYQDFETNYTTDEAELVDTFHYELKSLEAGNPMPTGNSMPAGNPMPAEADNRVSDEMKDGVYSFEIEGDAKYTTAPIFFTHAGVYSYQLVQSDKKEVENLQYDDSVYTVNVYVRNKADGSLLSEVTVKKDDEAGKSDRIEMHPTYIQETTSTTTPTPEGVKPDDKKTEDKKTEDKKTGDKKFPDGNDITAKDAAKKKSGQADTGDNTSSAVWCMAIGMSMLLLVTFLMLRKKRK